MRLIAVGLTVRREVFPKAVVAPFAFVDQTLAALALDQTFAFATVGDDDDAQFLVNFAFAVPITAGSTDFYFGGDNQFGGHGRWRW